MYNMTDARYTVYIDKAYRNYVNKCNEDKWILKTDFKYKTIESYEQHR